MAIKRNDVRAILDNEELTNDERVKRVMDLLHSETDVLRDQYDQLKSDYDQINTELENAKNTIAEKETAINDANSAFEAYKTEQVEKELHSSKSKQYRQALKDAGVSDKRIDTIMRCTDLSEITLNKDGSIRDLERVTENIKNSWSDFIQVEQVNNTVVETPPKNVSSEKTMTKEEIMAVKDRTERRRLIQENPDAFK